MRRVAPGCDVHNCQATPLTASPLRLTGIVHALPLVVWWAFGNDGVDDGCITVVCKSIYRLLCVS
jgi:hypothetical protein